jgi:hypothetical protein
LVVAAVSVITTELNNLASGSAAVSTVNGASGVFVNTIFGQAIWADIFLAVGGPNLAGTIAAGANVAGWFLTTPDGSTYEGTTVPLITRPPDFLIPMPAVTSMAAGSFFKSAGLVLVPPGQFKVLVQNNAGQTLAPSTTSSPYVKIAPYAMQY